MVEFSEFCEKVECKQFIAWDCGEGLCISCRLIGESYNITNYPKNCEHLDKIKKYEEEFSQPKNSN